MSYELNSIETIDNKIIYYIVKDKAGNLSKMSRDKIKGMLNSGVQIQGLYLDKIGRVRRKSYKTPSIYSKLEILTGDDLINKCNADVSKYKPRDFVDNIVDFCISGEFDRVYIVHGLRRTGKTVALKHSILKMNQIDKKLSIYLITANDNIDANEIMLALSKINNAVIFIDEITRVNNIIGLLHILSDTLSSNNRLKIVLTGTDSYVFNLANLTSLFGRAYYSHSTLLRYSEYKRVTGLELNDYMTDGTLFGNLYTDRTIVNNINSMIIGNIINTIERNKEFLSSNAIYGNICRLNKGMLGAIVYYILTSVCDTKFKRNINSIASKPLGNNKTDFLANALNIDPNDIPKVVSGISTNDFLTIIAILDQLDLVKQVDNLANTLLLNEASENFKQVTDVEMCVLQPGLIWSLLTIFNIQDSIKIGKITENIVIMSLLGTQRIKGYHLVSIGFLKYEYNNQQHEIDVVLRVNNDNTFREHNVYIEVKSGCKKEKSYIKHLTDKSLSLFKSGIKLVIYTGKTDLTSPIKWVNLEDFISNPWQYII